MKSSQIEIVRQPVTADAVVYRRFARAVVQSPYGVDSVVVGFVNTFDRELAFRNRAVKLSALLGRSDDARTVFSSREVCEQITKKATARAVRGDAVGLRIEKLLSAPLTVATQVDSPELDQKALQYYDKNHRIRSLLLQRMPYGELAQTLGTVLVDAGASHVMVAGTAGSLAFESRLGQALFPKEFVSTDGRLRISVENRLAKKGAQRGIRTAVVKSPIEETMEQIDGLRRQGFDAVEMEAGFFANALADTNVKFSALSIVSDIPGSHQTLEGQLADEEVKKSFRQLSDRLIRDLEICGLVEPGAAMRLGDGNPFARALDVVKNWIPARFLSDDYTVFRYNLARYLLNGVPWDLLRFVDMDVVSRGITHLRLPSRWIEKIDRDMAMPYTDRDVVRALNKQQKNLVAAAKYLLATNKDTTDAELWLMGGITKGRFGGQSDLDLLIASEHPGVEDWTVTSVVGARGQGSKDVRIGALRYARARNEKYADFLKLGTVKDIAAGLVDVRALVRNSMAANGIVFDGANGHVTFDPETVHFTPEVPAADEAILELEKQLRQADASVLAPYADLDINANDLRWFRRKELRELGSSLLDRAIAFAEIDTLRAFVRAQSDAWARSRGAATALSLSRRSPESLLVLVAELTAEETLDLIGITQPFERVATLVAALEEQIHTMEAGQEKMPLLSRVKEAWAANLRADPATIAPSGSLNDASPLQPRMLGLKNASA